MKETRVCASPRPRLPVSPSHAHGLTPSTSAAWWSHQATGLRRTDSGPMVNKPSTPGTVCPASLRVGSHEGDLVEADVEVHRVRARPAELPSHQRRCPYRPREDAVGEAGRVLGRTLRPALPAADDVVRVRGRSGRPDRAADDDDGRGGRSAHGAPGGATGPGRRVWRVLSRRGAAERDARGRPGRAAERGPTDRARRRPRHRQPGLRARGRRMPGRFCLRDAGRRR